MYTCVCLCVCVCMCVYSPRIFMNVGVTLVLWHWGKTVDWIWEQYWSVLRLLWLKVIVNWRKIYKLYVPPDIIRLKEGRWMAGSCRMNVTWDVCTGLSEILNRNEQSIPLLCAYMYTKLQTWWHIHCCHKWLNSLSRTILRSQCGNTISISAVVKILVVAI
jgi:hypothetical protein